MDDTIFSEDHYYHKLGERDSILWMIEELLPQDAAGRASLKARLSSIEKAIKAWEDRNNAV